jgi:hypothetical protein
VRDGATDPDDDRGLARVPDDGAAEMSIERVDHPTHYGGAGNPYEAIKVIEAWGLGFSLGNAVKYIARAGKKDDRLEDLKKARWYLDREIQNAEKSNV